MSFFDRMFNPTKFVSDIVEKVNATNHRPAFLGMPGSRYPKYNDQVRPHQPLSIREQRHDFSNLGDRDWQSKHNPHLRKLSYGVAEFLTKKTPFPFMYAEVNLDGNPTEKEENTSGIQTDGVREMLEDPVRKPKGSPSSNPHKNSGSMQLPMQSPGMEFPGQTQNPFQEQMKPQYYELRKDLMDKYSTLWLERDVNHQNMFQIMRKALSKSLGTQCCFILRRKIRGKPIYFVFGSNQIVKTKGYKRHVEKVTIRWSSWTDHEDTSKENADREGVQEFTVGTDGVFYVPFPCEESPRGECFLKSVWDLGIYQQQNRWMQSLYIWNGGIQDRIVRYPNDIDSSTEAIIEDHIKNPMIQPGIMLDYPPGANPEYIQNLFQIDTVATQEPRWEEHNSINNQDSPFPKMFLEGQVETGALGGSAPEVDQEEQDKAMLQWFHIIDPLVKMINETFFESTDDEFKDVCIIPFIDDLLSQGSGPTGMESSSELPQKDLENSKTKKKNVPEEIDVQVLKTSKANSAKVNSITSVGRTYIGNLFSEGYLEQDDGSFEYLDANTIKEFVESPTSVKEGYFGWEHPTDDPMKITPINSIGKFKVIGYDATKNHDITEFTIFESDAPEEIYTSPAYYSRDITRPDGTVEQTAIALVNAVATKNPRSRGKTKAFRVN